MPEHQRPFLVDFHQRVEELFHDLVYRHWPAAGPIESRPAADVFETTDGYRVEIDLPGVSPGEVELRVTEHSLLITGSLPEMPGAGIVSSRRERVRGPFRRVLEFPAPIDPARVRAGYRYGTFSIDLPKRTPRGSSHPDLAPVEIRLVEESREN